MTTLNNTLVVDLDGTLIKTDILHETFWAAFSKDWKTPFKALTKLLTGKAELKEYLSNISEIDIKLLPFNETVIEYIKRFRSKGGYAVLVTASNITIAKKIADHLGFFDEVHGSTSSLNLKSEKKNGIFNFISSEKNLIILATLQQTSLFGNMLLKL